jgi:hypothetical protein
MSHGTRTAAATLALLAACGGTIRHSGDGEADTAPADTAPADTATADTATADTATDGDEDTAVVPDGEGDTPGDTAPADVTADGGCELVQIPFEAEDMTFDDGFRTDESSRPYIGTFLEAAMDDAGTASREIDIPCGDDWVLWGLVWIEGGYATMYSDSFSWAWDEAATTWVWDLMQQGCSPSLPADWYWDRVSLRTETGTCGDPEEDPAVFTLSAGAHTFHLLGREGNAAVAEFVLTNDLDYVPPDPG